MKNLESKYVKLDKEIKAFEFFSIFLLVFLIVSTTYSFFNDKFTDALSSFEQLGILVSVLLVSKVATRQIISTQLQEIASERKAIIKVTHHLMTVINDLNNKIELVEEIFQKGNRPLNYLSECINDIDIGYQKLQTEDVHQYLDGEVIGIIWKMSPSIFGLKTTSEIIINEFKSKNLKVLPTPQLPPQVSSPISSLLDLLRELDTKVRLLRQSVDEN